MPIAASSGNTPAKRQTPQRSAARKTPQPATSPGEAREQGLLGIFQVSAAICVMRGLYPDAGACTVHGPAISHEAAVLAESNEGIAKGLDYLIQMGPYSALLTAVLPFGLQIAANHGRIDADKASGLGVMDPATLEAKVKADVERQKLEFTRQAEEAKRANAEMVAAHERFTRETGHGGENAA
jgi:hypothetical protein